MTYLDTCAWLKVYVREQDHDCVTTAIASSELVATSIIARAEARSGPARRMGEGDFTSEEYAAIVDGLDTDWVVFARAPVLSSVARHAGELAQHHSLRGCDAIHLASALHLAGRFESLRFLAFDHRLIDAAKEAGVPVYTD